MLQKKIKKSDILIFLLYFFVLLPFFKSSYLMLTFPKINLLYQGMQVIASLLVIGLILKKKSISKIFIYIFAYFIILFFSTLLNSGNITNYFITFFYVIVLSMIVDFGIKDNTKIFLNAFEFLLSILIYANFLSILFFENGLYINSMGFSSNWFLGYKNTHILYIIPTILISCINSYYTKDKLTLRNYLLLIVCFLSTLLVENSTGIIGIILICCFLYLYKIWNKIKTFNILTYAVVYVLSFLVIVILRVQEWFSFLIVDILHKDITFTGRTNIWDKVLEIIPSNFWLGRGMVTFQYSASVFSTHNTILDIVYKTGIIGLISYFLIFYQSLKDLWFYRKHKIIQFISIVIFSYFIMMLTEAYSYEYIIYLLVICFNAKYFIKQESGINAIKN